MLSRTHRTLFTAALLSVASTAEAGVVEDRAVLVEQAPLAAPEKGQSVVDPTFGVVIRRLTDRGEHGGLATAEYSQLQAFNADETRVLLLNEDATRQVLDLATGEPTHWGLELELPRWSPVDANVLYGFNRKSGGPIDLLEVTLLPEGTWSTRVVANVTDLGFSSIDDGCYEELSADGRYLTLLDQQNSKVSVFDVLSATIKGTVHLASDVDWVAVSDTGRYLAVQYVERGFEAENQGLAIYDVETMELAGHAADHHEHGDLGLDAEGNEVYVSMGYTDSCASGSVACYSVSKLPDALERGARVDHFEMPAAVGSYTSCRNNQGAGYCLNGDDYAESAGATPFAKELWLTRLSDGAVKRFAHHRSQSCSYFGLSRPSISRSGRYVIFTSDWARPNCDDQTDSYIVDLQPILGDWIPTPDAAPTTPATDTTSSPITPPTATTPSSGLVPAAVPVPTFRPVMKLEPQLRLE
ncbi:hypothetical protein L6R52_16125 [Myxococcota bacterium]|nr:hypothetical protein [Myxococcota bacterium]